MASIRRHVWIEVYPAEVWNVVSDVGSVSTWFPSIANSSVEGTVRTCVLSSGNVLTEEVVTLDDRQMRLQYRILSGMDVTFHLATVDVIEAGDRGALLVYSTDITPDELAAPVARSIDKGLTNLKDRLESSA
jgi:hypothetical protein